MVSNYRGVTNYKGVDTVCKLFQILSETFPNFSAATHTTDNWSSSEMCLNKYERHWSIQYGSIEVEVFSTQISQSCK